MIIETIIPMSFQKLPSHAVCEKSLNWFLYVIYYQLHNDPKSKVPHKGKKAEKQTKCSDI